jgi:hypothetical protein
MASLGGLIGGIMKGFGGGLEQVGQVELKKQSEMDLRKQMLEMESEKRLREDEVRRERDLAYIPKTAEASARAELTTAPIKAEANVAGRKATLEAENKTEINRLEAEADANKRLQKAEALKKSGALAAEANVSALTEKEKYKALIDNGVPKAKADALMADYNAAEPQRKKEAEDKIAAAIAEAKTLAKDKDYLGAVSKIDVAKSAGNIAEINAREKAYLTREGGKDGETTKDLERQQSAATERLAYELNVPKNKVNEELGALRKKAERGDTNAAARLKELSGFTKDWEDANSRLREWQRSNRDKPGTSEEKPTARKPIESFNK